MKNKMTKVLALLLSVTMIVGTTDLQTYAVDMGNATIMEQETVSGNQSEEAENSGWDGVATESIYETDNYKIIFRLNSYWEGGYNATIKIDNTSNIILDDWYIRFPFENQITNIWNAEIEENAEGLYTIKNAGWNQDIPAGGSCEFGFSGNENFAGFPKTYEILGTRTESDEEEYEINYNVTSDWGIGFNGNVTIKNLTEEPIEDWQINFHFENEITNLWNGEIVSHEGTKYVVKNAGWNQNIPAGSEVSFGFTVGNGNSENQITNIKLEQIAAETEEDIIITIDTSDMEKNEAMDCYFVTEKLESLTGTLCAATNVKTLSYTVKDMDNKVVCNGDMEIEESWKINDIGLALGMNRIIICAKSHYGKTYEESIVIMNSSMENTDGTNVDTEDTDGDGINNHFESILGTDKDKADTDGDEISDYDEFTITGTDPIMPDTDENGIRDGEEDFDKDGLNNLEELTYETNPYYEDSDGDGLLDGEEVKEYKTKPLDEDTDKDGLKDGEDVALSFEPINPDTDGDGIPDGDEILLQTTKTSIEQEEKTAVTEVAVTLECSGFIDSVVSIENTYNVDIHSTNVVGLVGVPVDICVDIPFETAAITFNYDESQLGETKEENLAMMWYDEENDIYVVLEDAVVDVEKNTVSYITDHFSTYLLVDKEIWFDAMRQDINYRTSSEVTYYDMAFAVDVSLSMETDNRIGLAKQSLNAFIDAMMEGDRAGLIKFNNDATVVRELTNNKDSLKNGVNTLSLKYGNMADSGIREGIDMLTEKEGENQKILILVCDGDVQYYTDLVKEAKEKDIKIYCVNVADGTADAMEKIAVNTGGSYYYAATGEEIEEALEELRGDTVDYTDTTDTDGDGLYDVYEINGMRLSNGEIIYTKSGEPDSDFDDISDYDEMGEELRYTSIIIDGEEHTVSLWRRVSDPNLVDSDGDTYLDKEDAYPLTVNEDVVYIFYEKDGAFFLEMEANARKRVIGGSGKKVEVIPVNQVQDFVNEWNKMGLNNEGKVEYNIVDVYTIFHGSPQSISIGGGNQTFLNTDISRLKDKKIQTLHLSSCNNGNIDWINAGVWGSTTFSQNMAITFLKEHNSINEVEAWDGVASYIDLGLIQLEFSKGYSGIEDWLFRNGRFSKWSKAKNGCLRESNGLVRYYREGSGIKMSETYKYGFKILWVNDTTSMIIPIIIPITEDIQ